MKAFECEGQWKLPDNDLGPVPGILRVSSDGELRLSLSGSLGLAMESQRTKEHGIVLGTLDKRFDAQSEGWVSRLESDVTLARCFVARSEFGSSFAPREEYVAARGYFGAHLSTQADFAFRRVEIRIGGLQQWTHSLSGFRPGGLGGRGVEEIAPLLSYSMPAPVGGSITGGEISLGFSLTTSSSGWNKYTFVEKPSVIVRFDEPLDDAEVNRRFVYPLQNLMTFVCDRPQEVEEVNLWREDILVSSQDNPRIRLIGERMFPESEDEKEQHLHPYQLLFKLADVEEGFERVIDRWVRLTSTYADACNLYFGLQYGVPAFLDVAFLGVVESLCLYYTRREDGIEHRKLESRRLSAILEKLPDEDAEWVRSRIWDRPFPPVQDILSKLVDEHSELMKPLMRAEKKGFIAEVMNTIKYLVHRDPEVGLVSLHGAELYWLTAKLRNLLKLSFLKELGFTLEKSRFIFEQNADYLHLKQIARQ